MTTRAPNIVFILTDQLRHDFLGCYGAEFLKTPTIDWLAEQGTRYETCISPSPICVPARAMMLTGMDAHRTGVVHNLQWLRPDKHRMGVKTWPEHLSGIGYHTVAVGKMHFYPWDASEGFRERVIAEDKRHIHIHDDYYDALRAAGYRKLHGNEMAGYQKNKGACVSPLPDDLQIDRWVGQQAEKAIEGHDTDTPLGLMVGFPGPHCPYDPPAEALSRIDVEALPDPVPETEESRTHRAGFIAGYKRAWADLDYSSLTRAQIRVIRQHYAASVERIDADVKGIVQALKRKQMLDNTIIIFTSDHGDFLGDFGMVGKGLFHEPSIRVPLIVTDYRARQGSVSTEMTSLVDLYPSLLAWAGAEPDPNTQGISIGEETSGRVIVGATNQGAMARDARWKLVNYRNGAQALFDLQADPHEQDNLIESEPAHVRRLMAVLTGSLVDGLTASHADLLVNEVKKPPPHPFYDRHWSREYPSNLGDPELGK